MKLELGRIFIRDLRFGVGTRVENGLLTIDGAELRRLLMTDERLADVALDIARPGEPVRIIPVKDVIEPRVKVAGAGAPFPGLVGKAETVGWGRTHVLKGCAVVTTGKIVGFQEGLIDMSGPGAARTPFSQLVNLTVHATPREGLTQHEHEAALRIAGLKAAAYLGGAGREVMPDETVTYEHLPLPAALRADPGLPRVVYLCMLQSQGLLHDTYVYGVDARRILPTLIAPTEFFDGAVVSGNCVSACDKNTTYHHQNNPVIEELYEQHGKGLNFLGVVISNENITLADKERSASLAASLVAMMGADGVIISEEGFGNPDTDLMMNCRNLEARGIRTVLITDEYAGRDGASQSLADAVPAADAVVSAGNANELILLPPMPKVIGFPEQVDRIAGGSLGSLRPDGSVLAELQVITGATNELGFSNLTARTV